MTIVAVTIDFNKYKNKEQCSIIHDPDVLGICLRSVRGNMYVTLFMEPEQATAFALKHKEVSGMITVPFVPDMCASKSQVMYAYFDERTKSYSLGFQGTC